MDLNKKLIRLKVNVNGIPVGSIGYVNNYNDGLYEVYIPSYEVSVFIGGNDFEKAKDTTK